jgi:hypothetical protein
VDVERLVVEIAAISATAPRREYLEDLSVQAYGMATGTEREPVEVDARGRGCRGHQIDARSSSANMSSTSATSENAALLTEISFRDRVKCGW